MIKTGGLAVCSHCFNQFNSSKNNCQSSGKSFLLLFPKIISLSLTFGSGQEVVHWFDVETWILLLGKMIETFLRWSLKLPFRDYLIVNPI